MDEQQTPLPFGLTLLEEIEPVPSPETRTFINNTRVDAFPLD